MEMTPIGFPLLINLQVILWIIQWIVWSWNVKKKKRVSVSHNSAEPEVMSSDALFPSDVRQRRAANPAVLYLYLKVEWNSESVVNYVSAEQPID